MAIVKRKIAFNKSLLNSTGPYEWGTRVLAVERKTSDLLGTRLAVSYELSRGCVSCHLECSPPFTAPQLTRLVCIVKWSPACPATRAAAVSELWPLPSGRCSSEWAKASKCHVRERVALRASTRLINTLVLLLQRYCCPFHRQSSATYAILLYSSASKWGAPGHLIARANACQVAFFYWTFQPLFYSSSDWPQLYCSLSNWSNHGEVLKQTSKMKGNLVYIL